MFPLITYLPADITVSHGTVPHILPASAVCSVKSATNCGVTYLTWCLALLGWRRCLWWRGERSKDVLGVALLSLPACLPSCVVDTLSPLG